MSSVTTVIITCHLGGDDDREPEKSQLLAWFDAPSPCGGRWGLLDASPLVPGAKGPQADIFIGSFNYFDLTGMARHLESMTRAFREGAQVFVKGEHDEKFCLYEFRGDRLALVFGEPVDALEDEG